MKITKKILTKAGATGALTVLAFGALSASAMGFGGMMNATPDEIATRQTGMFTQQASLIGATLDEVKAAWAEGKSFKTLATEKGVTEAQLQAKMKVARDEQMKTQLATLVSKGVITQAQADKRLAFMKTQTSKEGGKHRGMGGHGGMMRGFGF